MFWGLVLLLHPANDNGTEAPYSIKTSIQLGLLLSRRQMEPGLATVGDAVSSCVPLIWIINLPSGVSCVVWPVISSSTHTPARQM